MAAKGIETIVGCRGCRFVHDDCTFAPSGALLTSALLILALPKYRFGIFHGR
jgi:hypothetical protein